MIKQLTILLIVACLPMSGLAGSRGLDIAFVDATTGASSKEGFRLAELLVRDMRALYASPKHAELFPWSEDEINLTVLKPDELGAKFDRLLNTADFKKIEPTLAKNNAQDGLVVFFYDKANGYARLKLYDTDGKELLLLRLPLEGKDSAMKHSLMKSHRLGVLAAIGAAVRWMP